ncbi:ABC transporter ATP-binding protein [Humitalea sp. 24SJ18S-53]|uniref:ABC transporter ATP-binding protein n=1 Tax=Humitalea sp. 24SJ18S-53 TaxID=3422307 RepID=UPI003D67B70B
MRAPLSALPDRGGPAQPMLSVTGLRRWFKLSGGWPLSPKRVIRAVDGLTFSVAKGSTLGIVGESGCGKSTAARLIAGIEAADAGEIILDGEAFWTRGARIGREPRRAVQMVFQDSHSSLNPRMSAAESIAFGPEAHGVSASAARAYALDMLDAVGLPPDRFADRPPMALSGGQRQRVNIARALALRPRVLLLDEPVSALDKSVEAQVLNLLVRLRDSLNLTYVFISHDLSVVRYVADEVAVMYLGQVVEMAPAATIFAHPAHPYTRALFASRPSIDPRRRIAAPPIQGDPPDPVDPPSGCRFRTRCDYAEAICAARAPALAALADPAHRAACWMNVAGSGHSAAP